LLHYAYSFCQGAETKKPDHGYEFQIPFMWYGEYPGGRLLHERLQDESYFLGNSFKAREELSIYLQTAMVVQLDPRKTL
jgi:hypothetical protein